MRHLVLGAVAAVVAASPVGAVGAPSREAVSRVLDASAAAWSAGQLDRFMECYERSAATSYVGGGRVVLGFNAIRTMYAQRFGGGDRAAMGRLTLQVVEFRQLDAAHVYVIGRFHLERDAGHGGPASGLTTLLFHRTSIGWRIAADHS